MSPVGLLGFVLVVGTATHVALGSLAVRPRDVVATVGESVEFTCGSTERTPVNWDYQSFSNSVAQRIVYGEGLDGSLTSKFETKKNGVYTLKLFSVQASDEGWYTCTDNTGTLSGYATAKLFVLDRSPSRFFKDPAALTYSSWSALLEVLGLGLVSFGLIYTPLIVICICFYKTMRRPKVRVYSKDAELGYSNLNLLKQPIDTRLVIYCQDFKPKIDLGELTEPEHKDESKKIVPMKMGVSYFQFHWQMFRELKLQEMLEYLAVVCVTWHKTMAQRNWFATTLRSRLDHVCAPYKRRVRRTTTLDTQGNGVTGVAQLEDRIYAVCYESDQVRVFMARPPFTRLDDIKISDMKTPHDIGACKTNNCLYICDLNGNCVWRVTADHKVDKWLDHFINPYTLSVAPQDGRVLLVSSRSTKLSIYSPNAKLITNIEVSNEGDIRHVVCSSKGTFIMSQKTLVEVGQDGRVLQKYVGDREPENLNCPVHIALDPDSETGLFVLDYVNHRILQFNTSLKLIRCVADTGLMNHENPMWRLCYAKGQLMVGMEKNGNVEVYGMI